MIRYPLAYNPVLEYWEAIETGKVAVCRKIRKVYKKLADDINNPGEWHYSPQRGNHIIEFAENYCKHSKGKFGGKPVVLELWEKALLAGGFGFINDAGIRKYQRIILIIAKKNGKSLLASIVGLYMLSADGEAGAEVYAVATKKDQSKIIWSESCKMIAKSEALRRRLQVRINEIRCPSNEGSYKPLSSDSSTMDGLNVSCVLMDEFHQWKSGRKLYDIMADGITARDNPLIFMTSTAGTVREDIYDEIYDEAKTIIDGYDDPEGYKDERTLCIIYELDSKEEWTDEKCWYKSNPGLGTIKNLTTFREKIQRAIQNPDEQKNVLTKEFNIAETSTESWLNADEATNTMMFDALEMKPRYGIGGVDLSQTTDLTAAKFIYKVPDDEHIYVMQMYWMPEDLVDKRVREDHVPYDKWIEKGFMRTCPGNKIDYHMITAWFSEMQDAYDIYIYKIGYDRWSASYWVDEMNSTFGEYVMVPVAQGKQTLSDPMYQLKAEFQRHLIVYNNNPIDRWCLFNTATDSDINGNIQPHKTRMPTRRIDGTAALLDAYVVYVNNQEEYLSLI